VLVIAIENQLGLKYFAGFPESHLGKVGYGIEDRYTERDPITFGRVELSNRIARSGLTHQRWLFPYPDYKFPQVVLTERGADNSDIDLVAAIAQAAPGDPQTPADLLFPQEMLLRPVLRNHLAGHLANAFLVVASDQNVIGPPEEDGVFGYAYASERRNCFATKTTFLNHGVHRELLFPASPAPPESAVTLSVEDEPYFTGTNWRQELVTILNRPGWTLPNLAAWFRIWFDALVEKAGLAKGAPSASTQIPGSLLDALPRKLTVAGDGEVHWAGLEWGARTSIELGYMAFRAIDAEFTDIDSVAAPAAGTPLVLSEIYSYLMQSVNAPIDFTAIRRYIDQSTAVSNAMTGIPVYPAAKRMLDAKLNVRLSTPAQGRDYAQRVLESRLHRYAERLRLLIMKLRGSSRST
jgi:hypothetical protein